MKGLRGRPAASTSPAGHATARTSPTLSSYAKSCARTVDAAATAESDTSSSGRAACVARPAAAAAASEKASIGCDGKDGDDDDEARAAGGDSPNATLCVAEAAVGLVAPPASSSGAGGSRLTATRGTCSSRRARTCAASRASPVVESVEVRAAAESCSAAHAAIHCVASERVSACRMTVHTYSTPSAPCAAPLSANAVGEWWISSYSASETLRLTPSELV